MAPAETEKSKEPQKSVALAPKESFKEYTERKAMSDMWNDLNARSKYLKDRYIAERSGIKTRYEEELKAEKAEIGKAKFRNEHERAAAIEESEGDYERKTGEAFGKLEEEYAKVASTAANAEAYLLEKCIPELEKKIEECKRACDEGKISKEAYLREKKRLEKEIGLATFDAKQLHIVEQFNKLTLKLEYELGYHYISNSLRHGAKLPLAIVTGRDTGPKIREKAMESLVSLVRDYGSYAGSWNKALDFLEARKRDARPEFAGLVEADIQMVEENAKKGAPVTTESVRAPGMKTRFSIDGYGVTSNADGTNVLEICMDGSDVVFSKNYTLVVNKLGEDAIYDPKGRLRQMRDVDGNTVLYDEKGAKVLVGDAEGNWLFTVPTGDAISCAILDRKGKVVTGEEGEKLIKNFNAIACRFEREPELGEKEEIHLDFNRILERARKQCGPAERYLAKLALEPAEWEPATFEEASRHNAERIAQLRDALAHDSFLEIRRTDRETGACEAILKHPFLGNIPGKVLPMSTFLALNGAIKKNHPANSMIPENTIVLETEEKPNGRLALLFQFPTKECGTVSVILIHPKVIDAIRENDFGKIGMDVLAQAYHELDEKGFMFRELQLAWRSSRPSEHIRRRYGEKAYEAMRDLPAPGWRLEGPLSERQREKLEFIGKQEVFDALIHVVTHAYSRERIRGYWAEKAAGLGSATEEEKALVADFWALRLKEITNPTKAKHKVLRIYMKALGIEAPTHILQLNNRVKELRQAAFANQSESEGISSYTEYLKFDEFRDFVRPRNPNDITITEKCMRMAKGRNPDPASKDKCAEAFKKSIKRKLIEDSKMVTDEAQAIANQKGYQYTRSASTMWSLSNYIRDAIGRHGAEVVFNALKNEVAPWGIIHQLNHLDRVGKTYNRDFEMVLERLRMRNETKEKRKEVLEETKQALEIVEKVVSIIRTIYPAG